MCLCAYVRARVWTCLCTRCCNERQEEHRGSVSLQCVAMCCSVLQCVAALQCVAMSCVAGSCSVLLVLQCVVLQIVTISYELPCIAVRCSLLCCSVLQRAMRCNLLQCGRPGAINHLSTPTRPRGPKFFLQSYSSAGRTLPTYRSRLDYCQPIGSFPQERIRWNAL